MEEKRINFLSHLLLKNSATDEELTEFNTWFDTIDELSYKVDRLNSEEELSNRIFLEIANRCDLNMLKQVRRKNIRPLWLAVKIAAAVIIVVLVSLLYVSDQKKVPTISGRENVKRHDIAPGRNVATLTLQSSGAVINLDTGNRGVIVSDSVDIETTVMATTPRGGMYKFILDDGTKVWLNADSKLIFPSHFSAKQRKVVLTGEAYFEVAKNKSSPFVVQTTGQTVTVLGTHFNISSYQDEVFVKTTLIEGSVNVNGTLISPNEQATTSPGSSMRITKVDPEEAIAWQKGYFLFEREDIRSIMRKISRWYDVEIIYEGSLDNIILGGSVSRFDNVSKVLHMLQQTGAVKFKLVDRKIYVSR